jgi:hypothetical protein
MFDDRDDLMRSRFESIESYESAWRSLCCGKRLARCFVWKTLHVRGWCRGKPACTTRLGLSNRSMRCTLGGDKHSTTFDSIRAQDNTSPSVGWTTLICRCCYFRLPKQPRRAMADTPRSRPCLRVRNPHGENMRLSAGWPRLRYTLAGTQRLTFGPLAPPSSSLALVSPVICIETLRSAVDPYTRVVLPQSMCVWTEIRSQHQMWVVGLKSLRLLLRVTNSIFHRRLATQDRLAAFVSGLTAVYILKFAFTAIYWKRSGTRLPRHSRTLNNYPLPRSQSSNPAILHIAYTYIHQVPINLSHVLDSTLHNYLHISRDNNHNVSLR